MSITKSAAHVSYQAVERMLTQVRVKKANAEKDPGGFEGGSDHPTTNVDNGTITVSEGERSSENTKDVKKDIPASVDAAPEGVGDGKQDSVQLNIGTQQSATGDDPSSETESVNDKLPDPGGYEGSTSHPANLDNSAVSEKYSAAKQLPAKIAAARELGNTILAKLAMAQTLPAGTGATAPTAPAAPATAAAAALTPPAPAPAAAPGMGSPLDAKMAEAGTKAAQAAIEAQYARDVAVVSRIDDTIKAAEDNAARTASYLNSFFAERRRMTGKAAGDESEPKEDNDGDEDDKGGDDSQHGSSGESGGSGENSGGSDKNPFGGGGDKGGKPEGGSAPPVDGGAGGGGGDPLAAALAGGGGMPPAPSPADMVGGGAPGGGDPLAALGGAGGAMGGGAMGGGLAGGGSPAAGMGLAPGGGGQGIDPMMLMQILQELGIQPEQLAQAQVQKTAAELAQSKLKAAVWAPRDAREKAAYESMKQTVKEMAGLR